MASNIAGSGGANNFTLTEENMIAFATGAGILGTGGGGDPYSGRLMAQHAIREFGEPRIIEPHELSDDALVVMVAMLGAPTVLNEKGASGDDIDRAVQRLSERLGRKIDALIPAEIGGVNSMIPIVAAARAGLPLVNADGMGRAFPELQMTVMNFKGISATPFSIVDDHLNSAIIDTSDARTAESMIRGIAIQMGMSCITAGYPMTGAEVKTSTVPNTMTSALEIGNAIAKGRKNGDPIEALLQVFRDLDLYGYAREIFDGKIIDLLRETTRGFSIGTCQIEALKNTGSNPRVVELKFQNENLAVLEKGRVKAIVPDLICVVDRETAEPVPTESLRYGQRVKVIAITAPAELTTPEAMEYIHPRCFGLDYDYTPINVLPR